MVILSQGMKQITIIKCDLADLWLTRHMQNNYFQSVLAVIQAYSVDYGSYICRLNNDSLVSYYIMSKCNSVNRWNKGFFILHY